MIINLLLEVIERRRHPEGKLQKVVNIQDNRHVMHERQGNEQTRHKETNNKKVFFKKK